MKDYLKDYINTLSEDWFNENETTPIIIDQSKKSIEESRTKETNAINEEKKPTFSTIQEFDNKINEKRTERKQIQDNPQWDIYKERVLVKTLLHQRFNYFIIVYALTILSTAIISRVLLQSVILLTGFFILSMLWFNLVKVHIEYEEIYKIFHKTLNKNNVLSIIETKLEQRQSFLSQLPMNSVLAYGVPSLCLISILCYLTIIFLFI